MTEFSPAKIEEASRLFAMRVSTLQRLHLDCLRTCYRDCVELAEALIAKRTDPAADEEERRHCIFILSQYLFDKHAMNFETFCEFFLSLEGEK